MKRSKRLSSRVFAMLLAMSAVSPAFAGEVAPELEAQLKGWPANRPVAVIVTLAARPDLNAVKERDMEIRTGKVEQKLRLHADAAQPPIVRLLQNLKATNIKTLWIANSIAATVPAGVIRKIARVPGVASVHADMVLAAPSPGTASSAPPEWNLTAVHVPELWNLGHNGTGIVVATIDTGVDVQHPDLATRYRGGSNSWFDPHGQHATPADFAGVNTGHGTRTMGILVAGDAGGTSVGVAPGAQWIAAKVFNDSGTASESNFHQVFQWLLDPDGNTLTNDAPDVVNGSFQVAAAGNCSTLFQSDIQTLKTAGIAVAFAAGNSGPYASSSSSPANNPGSFAAGAVDEFLGVAYFSARGPNACDGTVFPNIVAPGASINTTDLSYGGMPLYTWVDGTSFSTPHVAGAMALLMGAVPNLSVSALETALTDTATDLGSPGADNDYGHGLLNVGAAYALLSGGAQNPVAVEDSYVLQEDAGLTVAAAGVLGNDSDPQNNPLTAVLVSGVSHGTLALNADGSFDYMPEADYNGTDSFTYKANDGSHDSGAATVSITVNPVNDAPVAQADAATLDQGATAVIAVVANDSDVDNLVLTPVIAAIPGHGTATVNPDGTVSYTHDGTATTTDSFSYRASDGDLSSASVTVNLTINPVIVPVGNADAFGVDEDSALTAPAPGVLGNDTPTGGLTAQLVSGPVHAASFSLNADGSFGYTPAANYAGADSFVYRAVIGNSQSTDVTVTLTVKAVNDAPVALNDGPLAVATGQVLSGAVLTNDSDPEGDVLAAVLEAPPVAGILTLNANGSFSYDAAGVAAGSYSFSYRASDGQSVNGLSNVATVSINVAAAVNAAPVANADTFLYRPKLPRTVSAPGVLANDSDAEGSPLSAQYVTNSLSGGGTLNFSANGSFTYLRTSASNVSFRYLASDGSLSSSPAAGATVNLRSDSAPATGSDNCTYDRSAATVTKTNRCAVQGSLIVKMNLAANDTDPNVTTNVPSDGIGKTVVPGSTVLTAASNGVNLLANPQCGQAAIGTNANPRATVLNNCDGTVTVTMAATNTASVVYSYRISDDLGAQSSARQVTLNSVQ